MNKKIKIGAGIVILIGFYFFFFGGNQKYIFKAKDLEIKNITNKSDFENIIVKNLYDKIVDECEKSRIESRRDYYEVESFGGVGGLGLHTASVKSVERLAGSDSGGGWWNNANGGIEDSLKSTNIYDNIDGGLMEGVNYTKDAIDFEKTEINKEDSKKVSFSTTNIQKKMVDEGDVLKQTKDYIFYFSKKQAKIFIIKPVLGEDFNNLKDYKKIWVINIPKDLTMDAELFVNKNRLVYLASRNDYNNNNTVVGVYDISELNKEKVTLLKVFETKGQYFKSRLINNNLYIISNYSIKPLKNKICNRINKENSMLSEFIEYFTGIDFNSRNEEIFDDFKEDLETFAYKFDKGKKLASTKKSKEKLEKINLFYTEKDLNTNISNLNFNIISVLDIEKENTKAVQHLLFGDLDGGEIHMTLDNLYLVNSYYKSKKWECNFSSLCYQREFNSGNFTSISKLAINNQNLEYKKTKIIPGKPINQYSMDEDKGYFRIFTTTGNRKTGSSLYVFSPKFDLIGKLEKIKPWEEFKSARFIGDKAFLVTFRNTDPLFVIDLHSPAKPKIIGELQIPGYSKYLHPYGVFGNKQYLIGLGEENGKIKIDLYEINYSKKELGGKISVKQKYSKKIGKNRTWTSALENPRTFVWDKKEKKLYLPYFKDYFFKKFGVLGLKIDKDSGIEIFLDKTDRKNIATNREISLYDFKEIDPRVGYYKQENNSIVFFINNDFIEFINPDFKDKTKYVIFGN